MKYSIDRMISKGQRIFGFGWLFDRQLAIASLALELRLTDDTVVTLAVESGRTRDDVAQAYPGVPNATHSGFFVYGGWVGAPLAEAALAGKTADGIAFRLAVPVTAGGDRGLWPSDIHFIWITARAWALLRRGRFRILAQKARRWLTRPVAIPAGSSSATMGPLTQLAHSPAMLIVDHDLGGGANMYRERVAAEHIRSGRRVAILTFQVKDLSYVLELRNEHAVSRFEIASLDTIYDLAKQGAFRAILFNNAVSFERPEEVPTLLLALKRDFALDFSIVMHDYQAICPSHFLLDHRGLYCDLPAISTCKTCIGATRDGFVSLYAARDIVEWRLRWGACLAAADEVLCFSRAARDLLLRAFPSLDRRRIEIVPHHIGHLPLRRVQLNRGAPLHIGVVGHIDRAKGAHVIHDLAHEVLRRGLPVRISIIGTVSGNVPHALVSETGPYAHDELPTLIEKSGANLFLFPSVVPETFSFVTRELIQLGVPLACFNIGAQAEWVSEYELGRVFPRDIGADLLDGLLAFHAALTAPNRAPA